MIDCRGGGVLMGFINQWLWPLITGRAKTMAEFEIYKDKADEYRWRLRADNYKIIADSGEGYKDKSDCEHGIDLVKQQAPGADIEDKT